MAPPRTLVLVLAGGAGGRLGLLTERRAKPAVPYAGSYRLVDVVLSNALHSGISDVWVIQQHHPASLSDHLANGRPWDLDRTNGGLLTLPPHLGTRREGWHSGTADALWRNAELVRELAPDAMVVVSADAVYRLDYAEVVRRHLESRDVVTMVTTKVDPDDAGRYGVVRADGGRILDYAYKPDEPEGNLVSNEVFVMTPGPVLDLLDELAEEGGDDGLSDLGDDLLPRLVDDGRVGEHRLEGYWRDLGTIDAYWLAHQDLVDDPPPFSPDETGWPLRSRPSAHGPARVLARASVSDSLVSPGVRIEGTVTRSVLSPGVVVEAGASVHDSVLLPGAVVRRGARVVRSVVDDRVEVGEGAQVGGDGEVTVLGLGAGVEPGSSVPAGAVHPDADG